MVHPLDWLSVGGSFVKRGQRLCRSRLFRQSGYSDRRQPHATAGRQAPPYRQSLVSLRTEYLAGKDGHVKRMDTMQPASVHVLPKFDIVASYDYFNKDSAGLQTEQLWPVCNGGPSQMRLAGAIHLLRSPQRRKTQPAAGTIAGAFLIYENILHSFCTFVEYNHLMNTIL